MSILLVGTGDVARRAARQIVDTAGAGQLVIASADPTRARGLAAALRADARALDGTGVRLPDGVTTVAVATTGASARDWVRVAAAAGIPVATVHEDVGGRAAAGAGGVVTGCAMVPGVSDVLARHAADLFDRVDEVHVARAGGAGPVCVADVRTIRRETPGEWRDGEWRANRAFGPELVWFPDPVGVRECQLVRAGVDATVATVPDANYVSVRCCGAPSTGWLSTRVRRNPVDSGWGAARVEVTGERDGAADTVVYAVVDRTGVIAGTTLALAALGLAGVVEAGPVAAPGVRALGESVTPVPFLTELAARGVRAASFEGVVPA